MDQVLDMKDPKAKTKLDVSRASFTEKPAPRTQRCTCGCGEQMLEGQMIWARPFVKRGKSEGETRLIDLEQHYQDWLDKVAHKHAARIANHDSKFASHIGRDVDDET